MADTPNYITNLTELLKHQNQTDIAKSIGVTHATLNRWLHGGHTPHPRHITAIQTLCEEREFTTQLGDAVLYKKWINKFRKLKSEKNIPGFILGRADLREIMTLNLTYNTNRIEGSTLSLRDTQSILSGDNVVAGHSFTEHLEARNHAIAFFNMVQASELGFAIDADYILTMHRSLMSAILSNAGQLRTHAVRIVGSRTTTTNPASVYDKFNALARQMGKTKDPVGIIMQHAFFEQVHPFSDGNGRMGRLLINHQLLVSGYPPIVIRAERKTEYYDALEAAQTKLNFAPIIKFCYEEIVYTLSLMQD